jgi:hypothetical protein
VSFKHDAADCFADIIENIERIERYVLGFDEEAFDRDERTRDAVERCLERICEAAHGSAVAAPRSRRSSLGERFVAWATGFATPMTMSSWTRSGLP